MRLAIILFAAVGALALPTSPITGLSEPKAAMKREESSSVKEVIGYPKSIYKRKAESSEDIDSIPYSYHPPPY